MLSAKKNQRFEQPLVFALDQVVSILGPRREFAYTNKGPLHLMLDDGSIVVAESTGDGNFELENGLGTVAVSDITGLWTGEQALYPSATDLDVVKAVVVYPTCRFTARQFSLDAEWLRIEADSLERLQQNTEFDVVGEEENAVARSIGRPDPQNDVFTEGLQIKFEQSPTVWFKRPMTVPSNSGLLRLKDGQQFVLDGSDDGFGIASLNDASLTIKRADQEFEIPLDAVAVLRFKK